MSKRTSSAVEVGLGGGQLIAVCEVASVVDITKSGLSGASRRRAEAPPPCCVGR